MNLVDGYIAEVGRRLPEKNRSDIEAEIRSIWYEVYLQTLQRVLYIVFPLFAAVTIVLKKNVS